MREPSRAEMPPTHRPSGGDPSYHRYLDLEPQPDGGFARDIVLEVYGTPESIGPAYSGWTWRLTVFLDGALHTLNGDADYLSGSRTSGEETCIWRYPFAVPFPPEVAAWDDLPATFRLVSPTDLGVYAPPSVQVTILVHDDDAQ